MRRVILNLLQCPRCRQGRLLPEADVAEILFGPVRCTGCEASFPIAEGMLDLLGGDHVSQGLAQRAFETPLMARMYERYVRRALSVLTGHRLDVESRSLVQRSLLGQPTRPILDLGCGTGTLTRRLAQDLDLPEVVGMDVSKPMLEEALAQSREAALRTDFLRAAAPLLPFQTSSLGAVILEGTLPLVRALDTLSAEIFRVLSPGGRCVATLHLPTTPGAKWFYTSMGFKPYGEPELRKTLAEAGFERIERILVPPLLVLKAEKPAAAVLTAQLP